MCLKVAGDYIAPLGLFSVLLGVDETSADYHEYYDELLEMDEAHTRAGLHASSAPNAYETH
ncbi:MAG: hypothetical protein JO033_27595 [Acidobacteriaceae bacterium]|nr:hypothetical protein [Acidobacteriota bacterium]MBV8812453.1 hypothetical protein [Acidobacteriaceae bacterium]MBV9498641.1 hypothetical protein [Acidobacteriaceae bacterium]